MAGEEVGELGVRLSLDSSDFNRPLQSVERNLKALGGELATIRNKGSEWGKSLEGLGQKQEVLGRTLSTQETKVKSLREAYEKSVREKGADAAATENLAAKLNRAIAEYTRTETELNQVNSALADQREEIARSESAWGRLESSLDSASGSLDNAGEKMKGIGEKMTVGVTTPILGIGAAALKVADDFDASQGKLQAQLGLTKDEAEKLHGVAENLWKNAFGESIGGVAEDLALIKQNMHGISGDQLESVAEKAYILQDAFGAELISTTKTAQTMMTNFGISADEAFDLMTRGFQEGGNYSDELLDTLNEYSPQFSSMGHSAKDMMNILIAGAEAGAFNLDKVGDAVKEFNIRAKDGSDATADGFKAIGLNAKDMGSAIAQGGEAGTKAFQATIAALAAMEDPVEQTAAGVALFGTQWEDLESGVVEAMGTAVDQLGEVEGATKAAGDALYDNLGSRATSVFRDFQEDLEPAGEILVDLAEEYLPKIADAVSDVTEGFAEMSPEAQENALMIAGIAAAAGPAALVIGTLSSGLGTMVKAGSGLAGMLGREGGRGLLGRIGLMGVATGPVGLAVGVVSALGLGIYALTEASKENTDETLAALDTKQAEIDKNDELIESYEALESKNRLTTDEMLRYLDVMAELDATDAPDKIAELKDEQADLLEKSTLTNTEMETFLSKNQEIIDTADGTVKAISDQGKAFAENTTALRELNAEKAKELENDARDALEESLNREAGILEKQKGLIEGINVANEKQQEQKRIIKETTSTIADIEGTIKSLEDQKKGASLDQIANLEGQIRSQQNLLIQENDKKAAAEALLSTYGKQMDSKNGQLDATRKELAQADSVKFKYEEIILAQAGITSEKGRGLEKIREELAALETQKGKQLELLNTGKINTAEYQTQIGKINTQIGKFEEAQGELLLMNDIAGKEIFKDINLQENPRNFWDTLDDNLRRPITKTVSIKYNARSGPQDMGMYPGYATGTSAGGHPGGLAIVGDGVGNNAGRELIALPNGKNFLSPSKPMMLDLPKGTSVLSATDTRKALGSIPRYATGTKDAKPFELVNYDSRLKAVAAGSGVARIREIRQAEIDSLEAQIAVLTKEGATIKELSQAKEKEARLSKLQAEKSKEFQSRIKEQQITISALERAYKSKKITLAEYNTQVGAAQSEIHKLTAEQLAHNDSLKKNFDVNISDQTKIRTIRQSNMELLEKEIESLKREGASQKELNQAKQKEGELNRLRNQKQKEYENRLKDQQKVINSINSSYKKGLITREKYNETIAEATVEMNDLKMETLAFYESMSEAQEEATQAIREDLARLMDEVASAQTEAFEKAMDKQISALSEKQKQAESLFKDETEAFIDELNRQKEAAIDAFDQQTKAHEDSINQQIENINKRRDAELAAIDAQLAALEEKEKQESREEVEAGWATEQANLERRFKVADFMQDEETVKAVAQEQADLQNTIDKQRLEWQREDLKESLKLEQDKINESYAQQEEALKTALDLYNEQRELERDALEARYEMRELQYEAMRALQLEAIEREHEMAMEAAEREFELQKQRFEALHEELVKHLENGTMTQEEANKAWVQAVKDAGIDQVYQEIENQEKSKAELNKYVAGYLEIGKSYGDNLVDGVIGTLNSRLSQVQAAAARLRGAMGATAGLASTYAVANVASNHSAIAKAVPPATSRLQPINFNLDGQPIAEYVLDIATGAVQVVSRKG